MKRFTIKQKSKNLSICLKPVTERQRFALACQCDMCLNYQNKRLKELVGQSQRAIQASLDYKITHHYPESQIDKILQLLMLPNNKIVRRGIEIFFPEICFFQEGQPVQFYYTKDVEDYHLVRLRKQKVTATLMQKLFTQRKRSYRDKIIKILNVSCEEKKELSGPNKKDKNGLKRSSDSLNCSILRFIDGCETIVTEIELMLILQKRKQDPFWKQIQYIKNYIYPYYAHEQSFNVLSIHYTAQNPLFRDLFCRAFDLMENYAQKILPPHDKHISDEDELIFMQGLLSQSKQAFLTYNLYKIVAFIEVISDEKIMQCTCKMMVNELRKCYLLQVPMLKMKPLVKYDWTNQKYKQMTNEKEYDKYYRQVLNMTPKTTARSEIIEGIMKDEYEQLKKKKGISLTIQQDVNQKLNAQFFRFMHPHIQRDLHEIIKEDIPFKQFKRKYLGKTEERKSLFKPFNSRFVRELHKLTPIKTTICPKSLGSTIHSDIKSNEKHEATWRSRNVSSYWKTLQL